MRWSITSGSATPGSIAADQASLGLVTPGLFLLAATARQRGNAVTVWHAPRPLLRRYVAACLPARARMSQNVPSSLQQHQPPRGCSRSSTAGEGLAQFSVKLQ
jgi:hypothetical protein